MSKWRTVKLIDVCKNIFAGGDVPKNNYSLKKDDNYSIPIYTNGEQNLGLYGYTTKARVTEPSITVSARGTIGFTAIRTTPFFPAIRLITLTPNDEIDIRYLFYVTQNYKFDNGGTSIPQLTVPMLKCYSFPLPPLETQRQIASTLDKVTHTIDLCNQIIEKLDLLVKARFVEMFGEIDNIKTISDVCSIITDGTHQPPKFTQNGIPFLFVSNIVTNEITYNAEKFISEETYNELYKRTPIEIGDIVLSTVGSYGRTAVVKSDKKFLFQRHIAYLKPIKSIVNSTYLHSAILSEKVQEQIEYRVKGIAQKTLNISEIRKITVPIPTLTLQKQFAAFVEQTDKSKLAVKQVLKKAETLKKALMQEYFG